MPRIRYLKPEFFSDEDLAKLPHSTRLTFAGLWCWADREGRLEDRPEFLKAMIFPYPMDAKVNMENELSRLAQPKSSGQPFIHRYCTDGKRYIAILSWSEHQSPHHTEKESKIPAPPEIPPYPPKEKEKDKEKEKEKCSSPYPEVKQPLNNGEITVKTPSSSNGFEIFWENYPKKTGKQEALKSWIKSSKIRPPIEKILEAIKTQKADDQWCKDGGQYIPNPATWLNQGRWDDKPIPWQEKVRMSK